LRRPARGRSRPVRRRDFALSASKELSAVNTKLIGMPDEPDPRSMTDDPRIMLRGVRVDDGSDLMVDHPEQPANYRHVDGTLWTWQGRWRIVGGVRLEGRRVGGAHIRLYDLATE
jgi:hypothetical protein